MVKDISQYDITYVALGYFEERSFEIVFDVYTNLLSSEEFLVKEFILNIGSDELYESLKYHNDMLKTVFSTKKYELLDDFFIWKYSVYNSREVNLDYFLIEYDLWMHSINKYLYQAHSNEVNVVYEYLISKHESYKNDCNNTKKLLIKDEYVEIFNLLKKALLEGNKELFYTIVEKNLNIFNNDIFVFIEQLINPLMYEVGYMWQYNQISVAKEHLATTLTHDIIDRFFLNSVKNEAQKPLVLISTIGDESHNLGVKIIGEFLISKKFDVKNLGSKISNKELISSVYELQPELLILSVTLISNLEKLQKIIKELSSDKNVFKGYIIVGGQALFKDDKPINIEGVDCVCKDLKNLDSFLDKVFKNKTNKD